jgi:hypothetical protein
VDAVDLRKSGAGKEEQANHSEQTARSGPVKIGPCEIEIEPQVVGLKAEKHTKLMEVIYIGK